MNNTKVCKECGAVLSDFELKTYNGYCKWCFAKNGADTAIENSECSEAASIVQESTPPVIALDSDE